MHPEALILRRCYPVPVTFADLRAAYGLEGTTHHLYPFGFGPSSRSCGGHLVPAIRMWWADRIKQVTSALDEVYAVVDGREVRIGTVPSQGEVAVDGNAQQHQDVSDLLDKADRAGYWERPREVRIDLSPRPVSHGEVARAVLVGQEYAERHGNR